MRPIERITIAVVFACVITGAVLSHLSEDVFKDVYVGEDGPIEWMTVVALLAGAAVCFRRFFLLRSRKPVLFLALTFLLGVMFLFGAGEELSWGQRIFKFEASEWFLEHNAQKDTNIHNLVVGGRKLNKLVFSTGLGIVLVIYAIVLPPLYRRSKKCARLIDALAIPLPRPPHVVAIVAMVIFVQAGVASSKRGELLEFGLSFLVALSFMFPYNEAVFAADGKGRGEGLASAPLSG